MTTMHGAGAARPPLAWLALLGREPQLMQRGVAPRSIELTPEVSERLRFVQDDVNASIRYAPDAAGRDRWGVLGGRRVWGLDGRRWLRVGDCDDYAVEKLRRLIGLGLGGCARLVACRAGGRPHLVLAVDAGTDTLILDNRVPGLWSWRQGPMARVRWLIPKVDDIDPFHGAHRPARAGAARGAMRDIGQAPQRTRRADVPHP